jgi:hypothetical protein
MAAPSVPLVLQHTNQTIIAARGAIPMSQDVLVWASSQDVAARPMIHAVVARSVNHGVVTGSALCLGSRDNPKASHGRKRLRLGTDVFGWGMLNLVTRSWSPTALRIGEVILPPEDGNPVRRAKPGGVFL